MKRDLLVFSVHVARKMLELGFPIINMEPNKKFPSKLVFYFERTSETEQALKAITGK